MGKIGRPAQSTESFISKAKLVHGDKYNYSKTTYINATTKVCIICPTHGEFWQLPHAHIQGEGCKKCQMGVYSKGILDIPYKTNELAYSFWHGMLLRCFDDKYKQIHPTYKDCIICDEWLIFSNFKKWFEDNYKLGYHLDKDILVKGNKVYSPNTCCFVPQEINKLFTKRNYKRGAYPIGVSLNKGRGKPFLSNITKNSQQYHLGRFNTIIEAFTAYKLAKEKHIKELAEKYFQEGKITQKVYDALMRYEVEIID